MNHPWAPPRGFDVEDPLSRAFWRFLLSSVWLTRFERWERLFDHPEDAEDDLIAAGHLHLSQIGRLWGLDFSWDGLRAPISGFADSAAWLHWFQKFTAFIEPWWGSAKLPTDLAEIEICEPSDVLWFLQLSTERRVPAICRHRNAFELLRSLRPAAAIELKAGEAPAIFRLDDAGTLHVTALDARTRDWSRLVSIFPQRAAVRSIRTSSWGDGWLQRVELKDRLIHEVRRYPTAWHELNDDDRIKLRARKTWMSARASVHHREPPDATALWQGTIPPDFELRLAGMHADDFAYAPEAEELLEVHRRLFSGMLPAAGEFKYSDTFVLAGALPTVQASCVRLEVDVLRRLWRREISSARTPAEIARAIAAYHVRFQRIHPFADGNGRIGRVLLARQACLLGRTFDPGYWHARAELYRANLVEATRGKNLAPLLRWLHAELGIADEISVPGELALPFFVMRHT